MLKQTLTVLAFTLLAACGNNAENKTADNAEEQSTVTVAAAPVKLKDEKVNNVYQHYVHLTTALVNSDSTEAKNAGAAIEAGANELPGADSIIANAKKIAQSSSLEDQRQQYISLSTAVIALVRSTGVSSGELYVDYCPMANNEKGASWLSSNKDIKNPYFGDEMLTCGEVKETIK
ncbi:Protein of unknown function [Chitinophaga rupis]|uniref:DUF3347 domain-containing protein n=1 Tax=Chitinophaga rupis TaxID=573321 RepID=A0A1H7QHF3_9BACT|nr:DUF3347 domain-containing protein [Chitinophaga rupis]SEL47074.1 Protein of unknown function [Chitinophaga rupis]